jgi:DNA-binding transcriptional LysR family regulator
MAQPRISLEQWRALLAVVDEGGYAQASAALHKTQSAVTYAVQKVESLLDVKVFEIQGRKAQLTPAGHVLVRRARDVLDEAEALERSAKSLARGWEPEVRLAVEILFPTWLLLECFGEFGGEHPETRIELHESVLGGTDELLTGGLVDFAVTSSVPPGYLGDLLMTIPIVAAAAPHHPLHQLGRPLTQRDLRRHRHLVIRDTAQRRKRETGNWLGANQRWTFSHKASQIAAACMGHGFAWFPIDTIRTELDSGRLVRLPLREGAERRAELYLVHADRDCTGPAATRLAEIIRASVAKACAGRGEAGAAE